jgi:hypothetical protein
MSSMTPADLTAIRSLDGIAAGPAALPALGLLRACLEYRFAAEVALGGLPAPGEADIGIASPS